MHSLSPALEKLKAEELYRSRRVTETPQSVLVSIKGRSYLSFCSNDYLGLANHPEVIEALKSGADRWGVGAGAAHLVNGHSAAHHALEEELADFTHRPRALLFSTGYMANLGVAAALTGRGDAVFEDRLNHASLLDGGLLSGARFQRFAHADAEALARRMEGIEGRKLVMTDGVFSMDGDVAPLDRLVPVCRENDAWLMVDDAHGLGVVGEQGRGTAALFDMGLEDVPILMGTLGKGLGTFGAFVAGSDELIETLIQKARPYIYTTASPPAVAEATRVSLRLAREEQWRREHLRNLVTRFRTGAMQLGLQLMDSPTPIQPIVIGESADAMHASRVLEERGLLITAIRPPTVAKGTARLRITFSAQHTEAHIDRLLSVLDEVRLA